ncbi:hypothetical protein [Roseovarius confluentis]|uniref:hypothetical protein n=3 Tax=Roseovarius TaxID=74030 RepID=UPI003BA9EB58
MNKRSGTSKDAADKLVRGIKRKTRKLYSAEEKIRIVLAGMRGDEDVIRGDLQTEPGLRFRQVDPVMDWGDMLYRAVAVGAVLLVDSGQTIRVPHP